MVLEDRDLVLLVFEFCLVWGDVCPMYEVRHVVGDLCWCIVERCRVLHPKDCPDALYNVLNDVCGIRVSDDEFSCVLYFSLLCLEIFLECCQGLVGDRDMVPFFDGGTKNCMFL